MYFIFQSKDLNATARFQRRTLWFRIYFTINNINGKHDDEGTVMHVPK